ncbi:MAG TPA: nucleotidyltransferase family protein [Ktedonobacteraceae bacterium]|jgi:molybdenum cofactor cytidylyltransferase|nr:nucleotidyltransferase family protein [Ktedonobacteraceae bacterium]
MMSTSAQTAAIILAAGTSSRMGQDRHKLLLPLGDRPVLAHVLAAALASQARPIVLVLGHQANGVRTQLAPYLHDPAIIQVENPVYRQGMSTSLLAGLRTLQQEFPAIDSALILLGDQPLLTATIIDTLIADRHARQATIVAPIYHGKRGNPVLFAADLFPELLQVTGDEGGRQVITQHRQEVATIELGSALPAYDVDTWEAYQQVVTIWQQQQGQENNGKRDE